MQNGVQLCRSTQMLELLKGNFLLMLELSINGYQMLSPTQLSLPPPKERQSGEQMLLNIITTVGGGCKAEESHGYRATACFAG